MAKMACIDWFLVSRWFNETRVVFSFLSASFVFCLFERRVTGSYRLNEQWHIPLGSWKWYHTEPTFCRLCKMLITPLSAFKLICFIALERVRCMLYHTTRMQCALCYVKCFEAWLHFFQTALFLHFFKVRRACFQPEIVLYERLQHYHVVEEWHRGLRVSV